MLDVGFEPTTPKSPWSVDDAIREGISVTKFGLKTDQSFQKIFQRKTPTPITICSTRQVCNTWYKANGSLLPREKNESNKTRKYDEEKNVIHFFAAPPNSPSAIYSLVDDVFPLPVVVILLAAF